MPASGLTQDQRCGRPEPARSKEVEVREVGERAAFEVEDDGGNAVGRRERVEGLDRGLRGLEADGVAGAGLSRFDDADEILARFVGGPVLERAPHWERVSLAVVRKPEAH